MKIKNILLVLTYFTFLFFFIGFLAQESEDLQEEWNERSFEEIYGSPHKIFDALGTGMHFGTRIETNFTFISEGIK